MSILIRSISKVSSHSVSLIKNQTVAKRCFASSNPDVTKAMSEWSAEAKKAFADIKARSSLGMVVKKETPTEVKSQQRVKSDEYKTFSERTYEEDIDVANAKLSFNEVPSRYAFYLVSLYKAEQKLNQLEGDIKKLADAIVKNPSLGKLITDVYMSKNSRTTKLEEFLKKSPIEEKIDTFLKLLCDRNRLTELYNILESIEGVIKKVAKDTHSAFIVSASKLKDAERNEIRNLITTQFKPKGEVVFEEAVDPTLKGGYELYYDNQYHLDNSQRSRSDQISREIDRSVSSYITKREARDRDAYKTEIANANK